MQTTSHPASQATRTHRKPATLGTAPKKPRTAPPRAATLNALAAAFGRELIATATQHRAAAIDLLARADGALLLAPPRALLIKTHCNTVTANSPDGSFSLIYWRDHGANPKAPWIGGEHRYDDAGRQWTRNFYAAVQDDFGTLVEVPA